MKRPDIDRIREYCALGDMSAPFAARAESDLLALCAYVEWLEGQLAPDVHVCERCSRRQATGFAVLPGGLEWFCRECG